VLRSSGGRVLDVVGTGGNIAAARVAAYEAAGKIQLRGGWWRTDIAAAAARASEEDGAGSGAATASGTGGEGARGT
jgi:phosphoribosylamine--glycine ligase